MNATKALRRAAVAVPLSAALLVLPTSHAAADPMLLATTNCIYSENTRLFFDPQICEHFKSGVAQSAYRMCYQNWVDAKRVTSAQADGYARENVNTVAQAFQQRLNRCK